MAPERLNIRDLLYGDLTHSLLNRLLLFPNNRKKRVTVDWVLNWMLI